MPTRVDPPLDRDLQIGEWRLHARGNELRRGMEVLRLEPKAIEVLVHLAARPGEVVGREELLAAIWPGVVVGDDALTQAIIKLRKALGDEAQSPRYIETIPKRGYRLVASVATPAATVVAGGKRARGRRMLAAAAALTLAIVLGLAVAQFFGMAGAPWPLRPDAGPTAHEPSFPIVAVLPLVDASEDRSRGYFAEGITEDIIGALGRFSGLRVMSRNAVHPYKGKSIPLAAVRDELGARYVVRGSVRESGGRFRVGVELSDAAKGVLLWSERYEGAGLELFEVQERIARDIAAGLEVKLTEIEQARAFARPTQNLEAHDLVLRARSLLGEVDRRTNREAREMLVRAQALAPDYADVLVYLGEAEIQRSLFGWVEDPAAHMHRAEEYAKRVLASPATRSHARAHLLLARFHSNMARPDEARQHAERSLAANPADSEALFWRGVGLLYLGRIEEGVAAMESARRFEPRLNAASGLNLATGYFMLGRYRDAIALADILLARTPGDVSLHAIKAASFVQLGDEAQARAAAEQVRRFNPYYQSRFVGERFANPELAERIRAPLRKVML